jgi:hypothetical protein
MICAFLGCEKKAYGKIHGKDGMKEYCLAHFYEETNKILRGSLHAKRVQ